MKKQKWITGLLCAGLLAAAALPVSAAGNSMNVVYTEANNFVISIPAEIDLKQSKEATITSTTMNVKPGQHVEVTISAGIADGKVTLKRTEDAQGAEEQITSLVTLAQGELTGIAADAVVAEFQGQTLTPSAKGKLYFADPEPVVGDVLKAGNYAGSITFAISVANDIT